MQVKTILNRIQAQPGFVYSAMRLGEAADGRPQVEILLRRRAGRRPRCSRCGRPGPGYDTLPLRSWEFVPLWGLAVFFLYALQRVQCRTCGVRVEAVPWATGKQQLTTTYAWFLAGWAKRLSWAGVAAAFETTWEHVFRSVTMAVRWGLAHRDLRGITALGIDELARRRGHRYVTLVYQLDAGCRRLLWIGPDRKAKTLLQFFRWFGPRRTRRLRFVCSDMWKAYLRVVAKKAPHVVHILDRFHVMVHLNNAIDQVRAQEVRTLKAQGRHPILTRTRWLLLKHPEHVTAHEWPRLQELVRHNLRAVRSYLLKEEFQYFWTYVSPLWAARFLERWCTRTLRSRIEPMQKVARMLRAHRGLLLNWFRAQGTLSAAVVEGFNAKARVTTRAAYGFRTYRAMEIALYHTLGALPEPKAPHRFC
jgi:transposase